MLLLVKSWDNLVIFIQDAAGIQKLIQWRLEHLNLQRCTLLQSFMGYILNSVDQPCSEDEDNFITLISSKSLSCFL